MSSSNPLETAREILVRDKRRFETDSDYFADWVCVIEYDDLHWLVDIIDGLVERVKFLGGHKSLPAEGPTHG
jgi:hypothetical protein